VADTPGRIVKVRETNWRLPRPLPFGGAPQFPFGNGETLAPLGLAPPAEMLGLLGVDVGAVALHDQPSHLGRGDDFGYLEQTQGARLLLVLPPSRARQPGFLNVRGMLHRLLLSVSSESTSRRPGDSVGVGLSRCPWSCKFSIDQAPLRGGEDEEA
jgi:hypothetical protein